jgi:DinB family protein
MTPNERQRLIARYTAGYALVSAALAGIDDAELDFHPAPGEWSAREVVHHLADSETIAGLRLRQLLVDDAPRLQAYDQEEYARRLHYQRRPVEPSLRAFEAARASTAQLLELMTESDWQRSGTHSESGHYSATKWLHLYADHAEIHAEQIQKNRAAWAARRR